MRLRGQKQNKRERRVLKNSLFAYISNMGTDHDKLITKLNRSKYRLLNNLRIYRNEYVVLCNEEEIISYRRMFYSMI